MSERDFDIVSEYHAHIYFDGPKAREHAYFLRERLLAEFGCMPGGIREVAAGPHPKPDILVHIPVSHFAEVVPYLMLNRAGLSILVHPETGSPVEDHTDNALWLGTALPVDVAFLKAFEARMAQ